MNSSRRGSGYRILIVSGSHGFSPTQLRIARVKELAKGLADRGATVHVLLLVEKPLTEAEEERAHSLKAHCEEVQFIQHPVDTSSFYRVWLQAEETFSEKIMRRSQSAGKGRYCPPQLMRLLRSDYVPRNFCSVIACGFHFARTLSCFDQWTLKLLDLPHVASAIHASHRRSGRGEVLTCFADPAVELELLQHANLVLVRSQQDAMLLRQEGFLKDFVHAPIPLPFDEMEVSPRYSQANPHPPRVLCVASDTAANLDGLRWFRRHVFPRLLQAVPTCRLRLIGESARHIEAGPGVDRIGWLESLDREYELASVVALPLRMGSGFHRRALEALSAGRTLVTTTIGAAGLPITPLQDAIISDDPGVLATETAKALTTDDLRLEYGHCGRIAVAKQFDSIQAMASICRVLGLPTVPQYQRSEPVLA